MPTPTERFVRMVAGPEEAVALDEAAMLMAAHARPDLDVDAQLVRLDELAAQCPDPSVEALVELLFGRLGWRGNVEDYADPRNSFLDQVLDRGLGIPISLSVLVMEVGRRVGLRFEGVGMPGHFLVRHAGVPVVMLDPFHGGRSLDPRQVEELFRAIHGPSVRFSTAVLQPSPALAILVRMLANLRTSYCDRADAGGLEWVGRLLAAIPGAPLGDLLQTARVLAELGRFTEAAGLFEVVAGRPGLSPAEGDRLRARASLLRARLN